ncbi:hypothetical protein ERO13_A04G059026v2 [Gossypium hirsutum]|uniref:Uncharacterized protein n=2 Tax=Gossypium TaxID=3633 RepID=A0A5D2QZY3_GOSTO|nr:hypothetical protein ERO13_A04G059026v2 [Gossypium hirsutum]TYH21927.1 hypothetical protein ES288_A04G085300v1 [Gossypium darwinii]TYI32784.1 hypothetical protein ES332_A04G087100v1 [Gossypium tomentosum]
MKKGMKSLLLVSILSLGIAFTAFKTKYVYCEEDYLSLPLFFPFFNLNWTKLGGVIIFLLSVSDLNVT